MMTYRLAVGYDFSIQFMHGHQRCWIRFKIDEAIGGRLTGELVLDDLKVYDQKMVVLSSYSQTYLDRQNVWFTHHVQGICQEFLVHVWFQLKQDIESRMWRL